MLWIFNDEKPTKTRLLDPWMVINIYFSHCRDGNYNQYKKLQNMYKNVSCAISIRNNNFPILLIFPFLMISGTRV